MWNPFSYISSSQTQIPNSQSSEQLSSIQQVEERNTHIRHKYLIEEHASFQKKIKQFERMIMTPPHHEEQTHKLIKVFSSLIESLEHFMTDVSQLKQQYQQNLAKIDNYDHCLNKTQKHNTIVDNIIEQHQKQRDSLMQLLGQKQKSYQLSLAALKAQILVKQQQISALTIKLSKQEQAIENFKKQNQIINQRLQLFQSENLTLSCKISLLIGHSPLKQLLPSNQGQHVAQHKQHPQKASINSLINNIPTLIFAQDTLTSMIISYLSLTDIHALSSINRNVHSTVTHCLPKILYIRLSHQKHAHLEEIKKQHRYFNRALLDESDGQNLKINAIKYLFFNHKPGTYILNMFQEDITKIDDSQTFTYVQEENIANSVLQADLRESSPITNDLYAGDKSKKSWRDYFKIQKGKQEQNSIKSTKSQVLANSSLLSSSSLTNKRVKKFSLAQLKNSDTFKQVQQQISKSFHHHVFSLKLPKDLETFGKLMVEQFAQLKKQLSACHSSQKPSIYGWTSKLLTLSKFLYLQSQELWTLGQNMFGKVMKFERQNSELKSELEDLSESQKGLRRFVDELAKNKIQMQKRIWQSQRKNGFLKLSTENIQRVNERLQKQIQSLRNAQTSKQTRINQLEKQVASHKEKLSSLGKKHRDKMQEFSFLRDEISNISWL